MYVMYVCDNILTRSIYQFLCYFQIKFHYFEKLLHFFFNKCCFYTFPRLNIFKRHRVLSGGTQRNTKTDQGNENSILNNPEKQYISLNMIIPRAGADTVTHRVYFLKYIYYK